MTLGNARLLNKFLQIEKKSLTKDEENYLKVLIEQFSLGRYYRTYKYLYEMLVGRLYDKKQLLLLIAALLLVSNSAEAKFKKVRIKAKRFIESVIDKDKKKIGITRSFTECKKPVPELLMLVESPQVSVEQQYDFIAALAGNEDEDLREDYLQLMEYLAQLEFIKRCKLVIRGTDLPIFSHQRVYIEKKLAQHRALSFSPQKNFKEDVKKYGIDLELDQNVRMIAVELHKILKDIDDLLLDYHKAEVRLSAREKLGVLVSKCIKEAAG